MMVDRPAERSVQVRPGLIAAAVFLCVYGTLALTVDFPRAALGFKSDEATYYMMAYSLIEDGDLSYTKDDLVRVWREFPSGPAGVFLQKGRTLRGAPDPNPNRFYYGKSFIYPLFAAPFDLDHLELTGAGVPAVESLLSTNANGSAQLTIADNGTLAHVSGATVSSAAPIA